MIKYILSILTVLYCLTYFSQTDTTKKNKFDSFEEYKKAENERFLSFKEKREKEIKAFIENEENWNLITIETKGNVRENVQQISTKPTTQANTEKTTTPSKFQSPLSKSLRIKLFALAGVPSMSLKAFMNVATLLLAASLKGGRITFINVFFPTFTML